MEQGPPERHELDRIVALVAPRGRLIRAWPLDGGISAEMTAVQIQEEGGSARTVVVRRHGENQLAQRPNVAEEEFRTLEAARHLGLAVPVPYHVDSSRTILPTPFLVIEHIDGEVEFAPAKIDDYVAQLASGLAAIHTADISERDLSFLPRASDACAELSREPPDDGALPGAGRIRDVLESAGSPPAAKANVLLHGDYWPGNTLWRDGRLVAVIDWEDAEIGDPLADVARARSEIAWIFGTEAVDAFTTQYMSRTGTDTELLPYWDLCAALRTVWLVGGDLPLIVRYFERRGRGDITEETIRTDFGRFVDRALRSIDRRL